MTHETRRSVSVPALTAEDVALVRLAAAIAAGSEDIVRESLAQAARRVRPEWVEEVILQSYLFAGFPRALNAAREWRRISGRPAPDADDGERFEQFATWIARGEATCATVYGPFYARLRHNIRGLHPALDAWMIVEGYGKVLSRPALDLARRELCVVAACAAARQDRQLHSHLHGALHAGAGVDAVSGTLDAVADLIPPAEATRYGELWSKVRRTHDVH
ncbi:MAG TPA: carboxymuconolactone decarboxylase family protein [Gemmatimonadaceae bacterium]